MQTNQTVVIREANVRDATALRELRLEALQNRPEAFGSDYEHESKEPLSFTEERLQNRIDRTTFVAIAESEFVGMTGIGQYHHAKIKHNAMIWGVYVKPAWRGMNLSGKMIETCIQWARNHSVKMVKLAVVATNTAAINSYLRAGFAVYGTEPKVILYNGIYYDELLMWKEI